MTENVSPEKTVDGAEVVTGDQTLANLETWFVNLPEAEKLAAAASLLAVIVFNLPANSRELSLVKTNAQTAHLWAKHILETAK